MIAALTHLHITAAGLSIAGFVLRGVWAWRAPRLLRWKSVKVLPHVVDTVLLAAAIGLLVRYGWNPFAFTWLTAKIVLLVVYIVLGMIALKPWFGAGVRVPAFFAAVGTFGWIVLIALEHRFVPFAG
jgi:uncharacterized membrane protein SirB2